MNDLDSLLNFQEFNRSASIMSDENFSQCFNKGCGQKFNPVDNKPGSCKHHPGVPVFHDALKGWSCCPKRYRDFTEFLNIPGCSEGLHSNEKPVDPEPEKPVEIVIPEVKENKPIVKPMERPSPDNPMTRLQPTIAPSLQQALEKKMQELTVNTETSEAEVDPTIVTVGTSCKNSGCQKIYEGPDSNVDTCTFHSGVPVFHEGMKYWSCCKRKTSDFSSFLGQEGCTTGKHIWFKKESEEKKVACRVDWHQTTSFVTVSIFAKLAMPDKSWVEVNNVAAKVKVVFECGKNQFEKSFILKGIIDPSKSNVKFLGTKVEINMKKMEPGSWSQLELSS